MKNPKLILWTILFMAWSLLACIDDVETEYGEYSSSYTIDVNSYFEYDLGTQTYQITQNPTHSSVSEIRRDSLGTLWEYYYVPEQDFQGTDQVIIDSYVSGTGEHFFRTTIEIKVK